MITKEMTVSQILDMGERYEKVIDDLNEAK